MRSSLVFDAELDDIKLVPKISDNHLQGDTEEVEIILRLE